jgi:uncharacterized protein YjbI with pentapeptide repeats
MTLLEMLQQGRIEEFNASRGRYAAPDLFAADLSGLSLAGVDLSGANLEKADLSGADLGGAMLVGTNLSGADCSSTRLLDVVAVKSRWRDAWLGDAILDGADFSRADLTSAGMPGVRAVGTHFSRARLKDADLSGGSYPQADFAQAHLVGASFVRSMMNGASFVDASMARANLEGAIAEGADFTGIHATAISLKDCKLRKSVFRGAELVNADLRGADLDGADLGRSDLSEALLEGAHLREADLRGAAMEGIDLAVADTRDALLDGELQPGLDAFEKEPEIACRFEDVSTALSGNTVGVLWENEDSPGVRRLRLALGVLGSTWDGQSIQLPNPADTIVARAILPAPVGFYLVLFVPRGTGLACRLTEVSVMGDVGATRTVPFDYPLAVRPVFVPSAEGFWVYGLGRTAPTVYLHRFDGDRFTPVLREKVPTARGFVGQTEPAILCKGGVLIPLSPTGLADPIRCPEGFPGRAAASCHLGEDLLLAWVPPGSPGVQVARARSGSGEEVISLFPEQGVTSIDLVCIGDRAFLLCTREGVGMDEPTGLFVTSLPDLRTVRLLADVNADLEEVQLIPGSSNAPLLSAVETNGRLHVVSVDEAKAGTHLVFG